MILLGLVHREHRDCHWAHREEPRQVGMQRKHKAHTEKADLIMIITDEKKINNFFRIFTTEGTERTEEKQEIIESFTIK